MAKGETLASFFPTEKLLSLAVQSK